MIIHSKTTDMTIIMGVKIVGGLLFVSLGTSIRALLSTKVSRETVLKCGDPIRNLFALIWRL